MSTEPFVSADAAAQFLSITRRHLLALARGGMSGAYAIGTGSIRTTWVFRLSELATAIAQRGDPQKRKTVRSSPSGNLHAEKRHA